MTHSCLIVPKCLRGDEKGEPGVSIVLAFLLSFNRISCGVKRKFEKFGLVRF